MELVEINIIGREPLQATLDSADQVRPRAGDVPWFFRSVGEEVNSLAGYKKNAFLELTLTERDRVATEWRRCFDEWGYIV